MNPYISNSGYPFKYLPNKRGLPVRYYLLTVESSLRYDTQVQVLPRVPLHSLAPNLCIPWAGERLELCLPDGRVQHVTIASFGVEIQLNEGRISMTAESIANPVFNLTIVSAEDIPPGTEVWLSTPRYKAPTEAS